MIRLHAENITPDPLRTTPAYFWTWKVRIDEPVNAGANLLFRLRCWCDDHVGRRGVEWNCTGQRFYFRYRDDAMLFKLTWHGTDIPPQVN